MTGLSRNTVLHNAFSSAVLALCILMVSLPSRTDEPVSETLLVMLGSGTPNADPDRSGPGVAIVVNGQSYLVDAGPGIVRRAAAAANKHDIDALRPPNLQRVFLTHLHSDHTIGLPDLILTPWVLERVKTFQVVGPIGSSEMVSNLLQAYEKDITMRLEGLEPASESGIDVWTVEGKTGVVFENDDVTVEAIPVEHGSWDQALAYKFTTADRTIVVSGDTVPSSALVEACNRCDILVHEVYSSEGYKRREPVWQRYHAAFHTSTSQLAEVASQSRPELLVLYHQLYWGTSDDDLVEEVRSGYDGEVVSASDLDVY